MLVGSEVPIGPFTNCGYSCIVRSQGLKLDLRKMSQDRQLLKQTHNLSCLPLDGSHMLLHPHLLLFQLIVLPFELVFVLIKLVAATFDSVNSLPVS